MGSCEAGPDRAADRPQPPAHLSGQCRAAVGSFFLPCAGAFLAGASAAVTSGHGFLSRFGLAAAFLAGWAALRKKRRAGEIWLALLLAASSGLGLGWEASHRGFGPRHVVRLAGSRPLLVHARVISAERWSAGANVVLDAFACGPPGKERPAQGRIMLTIARPGRLPQVGCSIAFFALLRRPENFGNPGGFDYEAFLARRGIFARAFLWDDRKIERLGCEQGGWGRLLARWRERVRKAIMADAGRAEAGVLAAMVLGERNLVPPQVREDMVRAGVAHTLAISGLHVGVVFGAAYWLVRWLLSRSYRLLLWGDVKSLSCVAALAPALAYVLLAGGQVSSWRAIIMVGAFVWAAVAGRPASVVRALALAAWALVALNPLVLGDPSFQLSFASVLGIVLVGSRVSWKAGAGAGRRALGIAVSSLWVSVAATLATAPITAAHFQRISLVAPAANLVALPLLGPGTVVPAVASAFLLPLSEGAARFLIALAARSVDWGLLLAGAFARLPFASWSSFAPTQSEIILYYACAGLCLSYRALGRRWARAGLCLCLVGVALDSGFWIWRRHFDHRLHVTFLSVGQGDAAVVEFPRGRVMVVDGGPRYTSGFDSGERVVAPFLRSRKIMRLDYVTMTHPQIDHCGGLAALVREFSPREIWWNGFDEKGCLAGLELSSGPAGPLRVRVFSGMVAAIGGVRVVVCHPPAQPRRANENDLSVVLRLVHGKVSFALTGDIGAAAERVLVRSGCLDGSTVLKVPHHGSATSSTAPFARAVSAPVVVFSVGRKNRFGFPRPEVVARYRRLGAKVLRTDLHGAVEVVSDGQSYDLCAGRKERTCYRTGPLFPLTRRRFPIDPASPPRS